MYSLLCLDASAERISSTLLRSRDFEIISHDNSHERNVAVPSDPGLHKRPGSMDAHLYSMQCKGMQMCLKKFGLEQK